MIALISTTRVANVGVRVAVSVADAVGVTVSDGVMVAVGDSVAKSVIVGAMVAVNDGKITRVGSVISGAGWDESPRMSVNATIHGTSAISCKLTRKMRRDTG